MIDLEELTQDEGFSNEGGGNYSLDPSGQCSIITLLGSEYEGENGIEAPTINIGSPNAMEKVQMYLDTLKQEDPVLNTQIIQVQPSSQTGPPVDLTNLDNAPKSYSEMLIKEATLEIGNEKDKVSNDDFHKKNIDALVYGAKQKRSFSKNLVEEKLVVANNVFNSVSSPKPKANSMETFQSSPISPHKSADSIPINKGIMNISPAREGDSTDSTSPGRDDSQSSGYHTPLSSDSSNSSTRTRNSLKFSSPLSQRYGLPCDPIEEELSSSGVSDLDALNPSDNSIELEESRGNKEKNFKSDKKKRSVKTEYKNNKVVSKIDTGRKSHKNNKVIHKGSGKSNKGSPKENGKLKNGKSSPKENGMPTTEQEYLDELYRNERKMMREQECQTPPQPTTPTTISRKNTFTIKQKVKTKSGKTPNSPRVVSTKKTKRPKTPSPRSPRKSYRKAAVNKIKSLAKGNSSTVVKPIKLNQRKIQTTPVSYPGNNCPLHLSPRQKRIQKVAKMTLSPKNSRPMSSNRLTISRLNSGNMRSHKSKVSPATLVKKSGKSSISPIDSFSPGKFANCDDEQNENYEKDLAVWKFSKLPDYKGVKSPYGLTSQQLEEKAR